MKDGAIDSGSARFELPFFLSQCIVLGIQTEANDDRISYFTRIITSNALLPLKLAWWGPI